MFSPAYARHLWFFCFPNVFAWCACTWCIFHCVAPCLITPSPACCQLLDGLISLSPLYSSSTNDLHVSTAASLHQSFPWFYFFSSIVHRLSGPSTYAQTQTSHYWLVGCWRTHPIHHFHCAIQLQIIELAHALDSLVRVSRRVERCLFTSISNLHTRIGSATQKGTDASLKEAAKPNMSKQQLQHSHTQPASFHAPDCMLQLMRALAHQDSNTTTMLPHL